MVNVEYGFVKKIVAKVRTVPPARWLRWGLAALPLLAALCVDVLLPENSTLTQFLVLVLLVWFQVFILFDSARRDEP